jgi:diguanylate cyclase (GGDEF)-like protein/PAS domain S-box-containing protein
MTYVDAIQPADRGLLELIEALPVSVFSKDADGRYTYGNGHLLKTFGLDSLSDLVGRTDDHFHRKEDVQQYLIDDERVLSGQSLHAKQEIQERLWDHTDIFRTTKLPLRDADGGIAGLIGFSVDETEPLRVAHQLRRSEQRYRLAVQASRDGVWDFDLATRTVEVSPQARALLGLHPHSERVEVEDLIDLLSPEELERLLQAVRPLLEDPTLRITHTSPLFRDGELRWLESRFTALEQDGVIVRMIGTVADVTDDVTRETELMHQATHDDLTGLVNRRGIRTRLDALIEQEQWFSLLYLDLDGFKLVNDSLGHNVGDELLNAVSRRFAALNQRPDLVARLGGDEFALLFHTGDDAATATAAAAEIHEILARPFTLHGLDVYASASIGMVRCDGNSFRHENSNAILRDADTAMYRAKANGKATTQVYEAEMRSRATRELGLHNRIRRAVDNMEFELHYQPIWHGDDLRASGVEALLRWQPPDGPPESPGVFLPYLEDTGLIVKVGEWVIDEACRQLAEWKRTIPGFPDLTMNVNLSRVQFASPDLVPHILAALEAHSISPSELELEVTETAIAVEAGAVAQLNQLRSVGVSVAIDDFGVGQSSLSTLQELPFDVLKIDRAFVSRIGKVDRNPVLVAAIGIARSFGCRIVAEGVETPEQLEWLQVQGCDLMQGYLLGRPVPAGEVAELVAPRHVSVVASF